MTKPNLAAALPLALLALAGCNSTRSRGVFAAGKGSPNEFAVGRAAPLAVPPDFALVPPRPGQPRPQEADSSTQALDALFGGQRSGSPAEAALTAQAGNPPAPGIRSEAGDPGTTVVNKGQATRDIVNAPVTADPQANATMPSAPAAPAPAVTPHA